MNLSVYLLLGFSILISAACTPVPGNNAPTIPQETESKLKGIKCQVFRDENGHVHVKGEDDLQMSTCMGYAHATDRAWQMDYFRRVAQGRTAEIHGYFKVRMDMLMRLVGLYEQAEQVYSQLDPDTKEWLWAYSYGVNSVFKNLKKTDSYEFKKLNYLPELWTPIDSIALITLQSFDQTRETFMHELEEVEWVKNHGKDQIDWNKVDGLPWDTSILKSGEYQKLSSVSAQNSYQEKNTSKELLAEFKTWFHEENSSQGSNNWVLSPQKSASKKAWLSNDPHLGLKHPAFWHLMHIEGNSINTMGVAFPGIPVITSGLNNQVAWGITNSYMDTARIVYVSEDQLLKASSLRPTVWVNLYGIKLPIFFKSFRRLERNPILPLETPPGKAMVLYWTGFLIDAPGIANLRKVMQVTSAQEGAQIFRQINVPSWNFVLADIKGNISYAVSGQVIKNKGFTPFGIMDLEQGLSVTPELLGEEQIPRLYNPSRGFIATANNRQWPSDSQWHGGYAYRSPFRAFRIEEKIQQTNKHDFESNKNIVCDVQAVDARFFAPILAANIKADTDIKKTFVNKLKNWNFETQLDCDVCALYRRTMDTLKDNTKYNESALYRYLDAKSISQEGKDAIEKALSLAIHDLEKSYKTAFPKWQDVHKNYFHNPSDDKKLLREAFVSTPGDDYSVNPGSSTWKETFYEHHSGASQRLIVEMTAPPTAHIQLAGINPDTENPDLNTSESGFKRWADCQFSKMEFPLKWQDIRALQIEL